MLSILPDFAVLNGKTKTQASLLLSLIGVANVLGRLLAGFLADRPQIDSLWVNTAALFTGGLANILIPFTTAFPLLAIEAFTFGLSLGKQCALGGYMFVNGLYLIRFNIFCKT